MKGWIISSAVVIALVTLSTEYTGNASVFAPSASTSSTPSTPSTQSVEQ